MNDADWASRFNGMIAYAGRVGLDGPGRFITTLILRGDLLDWRTGMIFPLDGG